MSRRPRALGIEVDNLRAALNWAFSVEGDAKIRRRTCRGLGKHLDGNGPAYRMPGVDEKGHKSTRRRECRHTARMIIQSALASCMMFTDGMTEEFLRELGQSAPSCRGLKDTEYQLVSLLVLWAHQIRFPNYPEATELADRCGNVAERSGDRGAIAMANYMRGVTYHHSGRILDAEGCLELSLHRDDEASRQSLIKRFGYDRKADAWAYWPTWSGSAAVLIMRGGSVECRSPRHANSITPCHCVWR